MFDDKKAKDSYRAIKAPERLRTRIMVDAAKELQAEEAEKTAVILGEVGAAKKRDSRRLRRFSRFASLAAACLLLVCGVLVSTRALQPMLSVEVSGEKLRAAGDSARIENSATSVFSREKPAGIPLTISGREDLTLTCEEGTLAVLDEKTGEIVTLQTPYTLTGGRKTTVYWAVFVWPERTYTLRVTAEKTGKTAIYVLTVGTDVSDITLTLREVSEENR